jgi:desumoylating isopeptidase 1
MSMAYVGIQIDAVYHTSLVFDNIEYFFGAGVQTCRPGATHHGRPMEIIPMGTTQLPLEVILDYLESLKEVYTPESYDLFAHNCNNFTNDFSMFLVGKGIPDHITSLPRRVLDTPFGQMLRPQLDAGMRAVTQAPVPDAKAAAANGSRAGGSAQRTPVGAAGMATNGFAASTTATSGAYGSVLNLRSLDDLNKHLAGAKDTASTIFFTSATCAPCKLAYPAYDSLAEQYSQALFIKVDLNEAHNVGAQYQVRATPTFMTYSRGAKQDEWSGADPGLLKANVERLINATFPPHPHTTLNVPTLQYGSMKPVTYSKVPPLDKLMSKLGEAGGDPGLTALKTFIEIRNGDPREARLPDLPAISKTFQQTVFALPIEVRFAAIDLLRCAMVDPRVSGFFAEESAPQTVPALIKHVVELESCPHNLRLVTVHLACNLFSSPLFVREIMQGESNLPTTLMQLITTALLQVAHPSVRVASAWLAFNLASASYRVRREEEQEALADGEQVELAASVIERLSSAENEEAVKALLLTLGYMVYCAPQDSELMDLCRALDAKGTVQAVKEHEKLAQEIASLL